MMGDVLQQAWERRAELRAEAHKIWVEGAKPYAEGSKLRAEGAGGRAKGFKFKAEADKLYAEASKLWAEGSKLRAEGDRLWTEAILSVRGDITLEWRWNETAREYDCVLETGERFVARAAAQEGEP